MTIAQEIEQLEMDLQTAPGEKERAEIILTILQKYALVSSRKGLEYTQMLMQLSASLDDPVLAAWSYHFAGIIERLANDYVKALSNAEKATALFTKGKSKKGLADSYNSMSITHERLGNYTEALRFGEDSLKIREETGDARGIASSFHNIGNIYSAQGNYVLALSNFFNSLNVNKNTGNKAGEGINCHSIGEVYKSQGNYPQAISYFFMALKAAEEIGYEPSKANAYQSLGNVYVSLGDYPEALSNFAMALKIQEHVNNKANIALINSNIGTAHYKLGNYQKALSAHLNACTLLEGFGEVRNVAYAKSNIADIYSDMGLIQESLAYYIASLTLFEKIDDKQGITFSYLLLGELYTGQKKYDQAREYLAKALTLGQKNGIKLAIQNALKVSYELEKKQGNNVLALEYHEKFVAAARELQNEETAKKIAGLQFGYQIEKKEQEVVFERQKKEELQVAYSLLGKEKERSESLLLNILPAEVAEELKENGQAKAKLFDDVTVLFTDFKDFTKHSERLSPQDLVNELHECFKGFDEIITRYNIEKIKTVGDAYLAVCGLPQPNANHAEDMVKAAVDIRNFMLSRKAQNTEPNAQSFEVRIGVHSGRVVAGIVGVKKFAYDIWGDTVNTAARMEQNGEAGKVNISEATYSLVKDRFNCEYRGEVAAKNKGNLKMYFAEI
jgi:class 3 adenylate cyclase